MRNLLAFLGFLVFVLLIGSVAFLALNRTNNQPTEIFETHTIRETLQERETAVPIEIEVPEKESQVIERTRIIERQQYAPTPTLTPPAPLEIHSSSPAEHGVRQETETP